MLTVHEFWNNIDQINPYRTLGELAKASGIDYHRLTQQRSRGYMPKPEDLLKLSKCTKHTIESLLTGQNDRSVYSKRVEMIANRCEYTANEEQLFFIEKILGLPTHSVLVSRDDFAGEQKRESSSALA